MNSRELSNKQLRALSEFELNNKEFLINPIIQNFLKNKQNYQLFLDSICDPTDENIEKLDRNFKIFYFDIRFISFISSSLYFNAVNFNKRQRKYSSRNLLTIDSTIQHEEETTFKDMIEDPESEITVDKLSISNDITDYLIHPILYKAVQSLSVKQKEVLNLVYIKGLSDTEIAKYLNKSQQAVSKIHKIALRKIHNYIKENGG
ncbi:sigma-70 family RNA polymerase sigma factor [Neobacillus drentensis]|uniref:RNA polymerase sigma factor n=1 Tax=Neobacillus drentensis TaxID=220684 RepID=UPI00300072E1